MLLITDSLKRPCLLVPTLFILVMAISACTDTKHHKNLAHQQYERTEAGLKESIQRLISPSDDFGIGDLDSIYHQDMEVIIIDHLDNKTMFLKDEFMSMIAKKLEVKDKEDNTWVHFHHIKVTGNKGFIILKRKVNMTGTKSQLHASIDFVWEDNRWQIIKENIYSQLLTSG